MRESERDGKIQLPMAQEILPPPPPPCANTLVAALHCGQVRCAPAIRAARRRGCRRNAAVHWQAYSSAGKPATPSACRFRTDVTPACPRSSQLVCLPAGPAQQACVWPPSVSNGTRDKQRRGAPVHPPHLLLRRSEPCRKMRLHSAGSASGHSHDLRAACCCPGWSCFRRRGCGKV